MPTKTHRRTKGGDLFTHFGRYNAFLRAVSSEVEHFVHTEGVAGSSPAPPTIPLCRLSLKARSARNQ